jgi:hypothetical protein
VSRLDADEKRRADEKQWNDDGDKLENDIGHVYAKDIDDWLSVTARVIVSGGRVRENIPYDMGLADLFAKLQIEIPVSVKMNLDELKHRVSQVRTGTATLFRPAPAPIPLPPPAPTTQVTTLKAIAWLDQAGMVQTAGRAEDVDLPPALAKHAVKINAACGMTDPRRRTIKEGFGVKVGKPLYRNCVRLSDDMPDDVDAEPFVQPVLRSVPPNTIDPRFTPMDRGPPKQMSVARNDLDALSKRDKP